MANHGVIDDEIEMKERDMRPTGEILADPSTSEWLRQALRSALERDPVEAANDADFLRTILFQRATASFADDAGPLPGGEGQDGGRHAA